MWFLAGLAQASTFEVQIADPAVSSVILKCRSGTWETQVRDGRAAFEHMPEGCQVHLVRRSGTIDSPGIWSCGPDGCKKQEIPHREVTDAVGRVNVLLTTELPPGAALELTCSGGFRVRSEVVTNTAVFDKVPEQECTLFFKGGAPAQFRPIGWGTWRCGLSGTVAICTRC